MLPRVLWLVRGLGRGGTEALLVAYAGRAGDGLVYEVAYTRADKDDLVDALDASGVPATLLGGGRSWRWPLALARVVRSGRYDIVHSHSPLLAALARVAALTTSRRRRPRLVATEHNVWDAYAATTRMVNAITFGLDDAHLAVSEEVRRSIPDRWRGRVEVVVHGVLLEEVRSAHATRGEVRDALGLGKDEIVVATVANYRVHKAWPDLLAAARHVIDEAPDVRFVGVGQGPLARQVESEHERLGLGGRFLLLGRRPDAVGILAASDVFVLASIQEGLPVALMEALALGLPVAATSAGGIPEAVTDGVEGILVRPSQPRALASAILAIVTDAGLRKRFADAALRRGDEFDIRDAVRRTEQLYSRLLGATAG